MATYSARVHDRLIVPAQVAVTPGEEYFLRVSRRTVPAPVAVQMLIDTGSTRCTLLPWVLERLDPVFYRRAQLGTIMGLQQTSLFWVRLEFPSSGLAAIPEVAVARAPLPSSLSSFHGVIGRDLLRRWESFRYQGRRGRLIIRDIPSWLFRWI